MNYNECIAQITLGINSDYFHKNVITTIEDFCKEIKIIEDEIDASTNTYVTWLITPGRTTYKEQWGCPKNGEVVFVLQASYAKCYDANLSIDEWQNVIKYHAGIFKKHYRQSTVRLSFMPANTVVL